MKTNRLFVAGFVASTGSAHALQRGAPPPPATETTAPNIPGVVTGGTQMLSQGFAGRAK
jgi:hypothetical protein